MARDVTLIEWNREKLERFKRACAEARAAGMTGKESILFEGYEFVLDYAKYLIEYLETKLEK